jgi:hypothetical protein
MKKILFALAFIGMFASCGKDSTTTTTPPSSTALLQNKWNLISIQDIEYVGASTSIVDTVISYGIAGDYIQFNANNTAYYRIAGSEDTVAYNLINSSKLAFDGDTFTVNTLTANDLVMTYYGRETTPTVHNWDNVLVLKK